MENPNLEIIECDWEVVVPNPEEDHHSSSGVGGVICSDYFRINNFAATTDAAAATHVGSEGGESDNPSWFDPSGSSVVIGITPQRSSSSDLDFDIDSGGGSLSGLVPADSKCGVELGFEHSGFSGNSPTSLEIVQNNGGIDVVEQKDEQCRVDDQFSGLNVEDVNFSGLNVDDEEEKRRDENGNENGNENDNENEKKVVVWWKVPLEVLKYCVWRVSPVWSISMAAAAIMGFVILRRRYLSKMKRKSQGLHINVTVDDNVCLLFPFLYTFCFVLPFSILSCFFKS
ncbi:hypothetical protein RND81_01G168600 [Saponaria officinalis]|uniref:Transmembrane protein n=1 Tax=Saponaria officinalis TaxID=3572 RepID=A0AAW1NFI8_SAPOF